MNCIELKGSYDQLIEGLMHHVNQDCGHTFKAKCYENGTREGSIFMYKHDTYPYEAVGRVSFIWDTCIQEETRALWIWTEPSIYQQLADVLQNTFNLKQIDDLNFPECKPPVLKKQKLVEIVRIQKSDLNYSTQQNPCFINGTLKMTLLKSALNRFRLTGPLSNSVLSHVLYPAALINSNHLNKENWWSSHFKNFNNSVNIQTELWESLNGADRPESYPPNCVIGFHMVDPRLIFPKKRTKALPNSKGS